MLTTLTRPVVSGISETKWVTSTLCEDIAAKFGNYKNCTGTCHCQQCKDAEISNSCTSLKTAKYIALYFESENYSSLLANSHINNVKKQF